MMIAVALALVGAACLVAGLNWRHTFVLVVVVGLLQDPARKLVPGTPVWLVGLVGVVFAAGVLGAALRNVRLTPRAIAGWSQELRLPVIAFVVLLIAQSLHSVGRWGNAALPAIGLIFYVAPAVAIVFAYQFAIRFGTQGIARFLWTYVIFSLIFMVGILAESRGWGWPALGEVGPGQIIYSFGLNRKALSGFYRASETAAWHIAMVACCLFILLNGRRLSVFWTLVVAAVAFFLLYLGVVTGRRKMLVYVAMFGGSFLLLFAVFLRGKARPALLGVIALVVGYFALLGLGPDPGEAAVDRHDYTLASRDVQAAWTARALTVFADIPERFHLLAYKPVSWAVQGYGWMGAGLGVTAQGAQYFGGGAERFGGAAEGGLGKITMDLGVPGVALFFWLLLAIARSIWGRLAALSVSNRPYALLGFGFASILVANVATFAVATQVFGDVFVMIMNGTMIGFIFALPTLAHQDLMQRQAIVAVAAATAATVPTGGWQPQPALRDASAGSR